MINQLPQINFNLTNFNQLLSQYGFIDFVLPFLLIFSLVFMILELSNLLKVSPDDTVGRKLNALFSFGFALLSIYNQNLVKWLLSFIPSATIVIIGFTLIVIVLAITNKKIPSWLRGFFCTPCCRNNIMVSYKFFKHSRICFIANSIFIVIYTQLPYAVRYFSIINYVFTYILSTNVDSWWWREEGGRERGKRSDTCCYYI